MDHVLSIHDGHLCRSHPKEAAIFNFLSNEQNIARFIASFQAEMSVDVVQDETTGAESDAQGPQQQPGTQKGPHELQGATAQPSTSDRALLHDGSSQLFQRVSVQGEAIKISCFNPKGIRQACQIC